MASGCRTIHLMHAELASNRSSGRFAAGGRPPNLAILLPPFRKNRLDNPPGVWASMALVFEGSSAMSEEPGVCDVLPISRAARPMHRRATSARGICLSGREAARSK